MANQQSKRQDESAMTRSGEGERDLATRQQYQDPLAFLDVMFDRMQRDFFGTTLFNALLPARGGDGEGAVPRVPRMQMRDTGDAIELMAELPGIAPEDLELELEDDTLTIRGETEQEEERDGEQIQRYVSFYRQLRLPETIDVEQAQASYRNGVLTIRFPKRAERSNVRQIPINTGGQQAQAGQAQESGQKKGRAA